MAASGRKSRLEAILIARLADFNEARREEQNRDREAIESIRFWRGPEGKPFFRKVPSPYPMLPASAIAMTQPLRLWTFPRLRREQMEGIQSMDFDPTLSLPASGEGTPLWALDFLLA